MKYKLIIEPALPPRTRHKIQQLLEAEGYDIHGGGTMTDLSQCDISFSRDSVLDDA